MKILKVDEDTMELTEIEVDINTIKKSEQAIPTDLREQLISAMGCTPEEFYDKYKTYKTAEFEFKTIFEPFKEKLLELYKTNSDIPKNIIIKDIKMTYVASNTRRTIDSKKLKEEEPEIAKKFTKQTQVNPTLRIEEI